MSYVVVRPDILGIGLLVISCKSYFVALFHKTTKQLHEVYRNLRKDLLANLVKDLNGVKHKYFEFGVHLGVDTDLIETYKINSLNDCGTILVRILNYFLNNTPEDMWYNKICSSLEVINRMNLSCIIKEKYTPSEATEPAVVQVSSKLPIQTVESAKQELPSAADELLHEDDHYSLYGRFLDPNDEIYDSDFKKETFTLNMKYCEIRDELYFFISKDEDAIDELRSIVQDWIPCGTVQKNDRYEKITKDNLEDVKFRQLWRIFSSYSSFFNFQLLERAIRRTCFEDGKKMIENYKKLFVTYIQNRLIKCPSGIGMKGSDHINLLVKLDDNFENCKMDKLKVLGEDICRIIKTDPEKLQIDGVQKGCICVTFHLHRSAIPNGFWLTETQIEELRSLQYLDAKILKLYCEGINFIIADIEIQDYPWPSNVSESGEEQKIINNSTVATASKHIYVEKSALLLAIESGYVQLVQELIDNGVKIDLPMATGIYPLHAACENNHVDVVNILIASGAQINLQDSYGASPLYAACYNGHVEVVKTLIEKGAQVDLQDSTGASPLHVACQEGHIEVVIVLIASGAEIDLQRNTGTSPLWIASYYGHTEVMKELIKSGAKIDLQNITGSSPLLVASSGGYLEAVKELIASGAKINLQQNLGASPLYAASCNGNLNVVRELIVKGAKLDLQIYDEGSESSPLLIACNNGHLDVVKELIASGGQVNLQYNAGESPLFVASQNNEVEVVKELIACGAHIDLQRNDGVSALWIASFNGHLDVVKELLSGGAQIDLKEDTEISSLWIASHEGQLNVVKELISSGAQIDLQDNTGASPLWIASKNGHLDVVKEIIASGAQIDLQDEYRSSPLYAACENDHVEVVKELIASGANIDLPMISGASPLYIASHNGHVEVAKTLISGGASINKQDKNGSSPVFIACQMGHLEIVKLLSSCGADINLQDSHGESPLYVASLSGNVDIVSWLIAEGANVDLQTNSGMSPLMVACENNHTDIAIKLVNEGASLLLESNEGLTANRIAFMNGNMRLIVFFEGYLKIKLGSQNRTHPAEAC